MKKRFLLLIFGLLLSCQVYNKSVFAQNWVSLPSPAGRGAELIAQSPNSRILFAGKNGTLYTSQDDGKNWKQLFSVGSRVMINDIYFASKDRIFLLTSDGLFESRNKGQTWTNSFQGGNELEKNMLSLVSDPIEKHVFYLGTSGGLFTSKDDGRTWQKELHGFTRNRIGTLKQDPYNLQLFIASDDGLHRLMKQTKQLNHVYQTKGSVELDELSLEMDDELFELKDSDQIHSVVLNSKLSSFMAIATSHGVFVSEDEGNHWQRLSMIGLKDKNILTLAYSEKNNRLFAQTRNSVYSFDFKTETWKELYQGLKGAAIYRISLAESDPEILYAASEDGIYSWIIDVDTSIERTPGNRDHLNLLFQLFQKEPSIQLIQRETIRYANVHNSKTKRWQWSSRMKAFVPRFSVGKSFSKGNSIDLDRGSTTDPDTYIIGPPDTNSSWDMDLNWELSDLLFNSAQTTIDSREKSMIELRDDLLNEVTRLYFERRRMQIEYVLSPPADPMDQALALLRIEELTASLDALTDGYLTKMNQAIYSNHPEFQTLWTSTVS